MDRPEAEPAHRARRAPTSARLALASFTVAGGLLWLTMPVPVAGQVVDARGEPVVGAAVAVETWPRGESAPAVVDGQGRFQLQGRLWPAGQGLLVSAPGFQPARGSGGTIVLHRWPLVLGLVVDDVGAPVPAADVTVTANGHLWQTRTDLDGWFALRLPVQGRSARLEVSALDHGPHSRSLTVGVDDVVVVRAELPRHLGTVVVESDPAGQAPMIDGRTLPECPATPCRAALPVGHHVVSFDPELYVPWLDAPLVTGGQTVSIRAQLVRKTGTLRIHTPFPGELLVDGNSVDGAGWAGEVPTGQHSIAFRSPGTWPLLTAAQVTWQGLTEVTLQPHPVVPGDANVFLRELQAYLSQVGGSYGVYLEEVGSGRSLGLGQDSRLEAASVIKLPLALYLLSQVDQGQIHLSDEVTLQEGDFMGGTGVLRSSAHPGDQYSYQELLADLIQQSDNTAWQALLRTLGAVNVDAYAASVGAKDCRQEDDDCTAREAGSLLSQLARGGLLSPASTQRLLVLLESTAFNDRINRYLGGVTVAHKIGNDGDVVNDCGLVFAPTTTFALCLFTETDDPAIGTQVIADVARAAYRFYSH